jgi:hypothetical protein
MAINTPKLDREVQDFKNLFTNHPQLHLYGQFYLHNRYFDDLIAHIKNEMESNLFFLTQPHLLKPALEQIKKLLGQPANQLTEQNINQFFNLLDPTGAFSGSIKQILLPGPPDVEAMKQNYTSVWSSSEIGDAPPFLATTFRKYLASHKFEKDKCFDTCRSFARKLLKARGITSTSSTVQISQSTIAQASVKRSFRDPASGVTSDVVSYGTPTSFPDLLTRLKGAIDTKCVVQCGVLSGVSHEHSSFPTPEHYILLFAYDTVGDKTIFLFWDPDAVRSNIASTTWGRGFGCSFFNNGTFSTAMDQADLFKIELDTMSDFWGDHYDEPRRHRYQVYYIQTLPL